MSLTIFLALCILSLDFMIYVLFKLFYGDRRGAIARRVAAQRKAAQAEAAGLIFLPARKPTPGTLGPLQFSGSRARSARSQNRFASSAFHGSTAPARHHLR